MQANVQSVTLIMAMEQEAAPIVARYSLKRADESFLPGAPFVAWSGTAEKGLKLNVVWCGYDKRFGVNNVATTAAAVATYASVVAFGKVDLIVSAGTAGAFGQRGAKICDVFLSSKCIFHSRRIPDGVTGVLEEYGFGHFRSPPLYRLAREAGLQVGVISTADSLDCSPTDMALLLAEGAVVKEMEAAAVAWVCQQLAIPFIALKSITDIIDSGESTREEFDRNLAAAAQALQVKLVLLLELAGLEQTGRLANPCPLLLPHR
jgi:5'-methylthioadenosine nucleosidase